MCVPTLLRVQRRVVALTLLTNNNSNGILCSSQLDPDESCRYTGGIPEVYLVRTTKSE